MPPYHKARLYCFSFCSQSYLLTTISHCWTFIEDKQNQCLMTLSAFSLKTIWLKQPFLSFIMRTSIIFVISTNSHWSNYNFIVTSEQVLSVSLTKKEKEKIFHVMKNKTGWFIQFVLRMWVSSDMPYFFINIFIHAPGIQVISNNSEIKRNNKII